jgi:hypothetical protein
MQPNVDQMLKESGAVLVRNNKHEVYRLPNGKKFTRSNTPSDVRTARNQASDLRRLISDASGKLAGTPSQTVVTPRTEEVVVPKVAAPAPIRSTVRTITPEQAKQWLDERNTGNRRINGNTLDKYARDMATGRWRMNGEPIIFARTGRLMDGQHRLGALVTAGVPVQMLVVENVPDDVFATINTGKVRTFTDVLTIQGHKYASLLSSSLQWVMRITGGGNVKVASKFSYTQTECDDALAMHPELCDSAVIIANGRAVRKIMSPSLATALHYLMSKADPTLAAAFFDALETGVGLHDDDPIRLLRERLIANRTSAAKLPILVIAAIFIKTWNATVNGTKVRRLSWKPTNEEFPAIAVPSTAKAG